MTTEDVDDSPRHTCPRRAENGMDRDDGPMRWAGSNLDTYKSRLGHGQPACSFCGSMEPGDFLAAVRAGAKIVPTDKAYKLYVEQPNPTPDRVRVHGTTTGETGRPGWVAVGDLTDEQRQIVERDGMGSERNTFVLFGTDSLVTSKFYTPHLSAEQSNEFALLHLAGEVEWGYPGGPYRSLYLPGYDRDVVEAALAVRSQQATEAGVGVDAPPAAAGD